MAVLSGSAVALGSPMPSFDLPDFRGDTYRSVDFGHDALVVMFWCNHCPYVQHVADCVVALAADLESCGVGFVAINANSAEREPRDSVAAMAVEAAERGYGFPYLVDQRQDVARAFDAVCTPDFYVYDRDRLLRYHGQLDAARPGNGVPVTGDDLRAACLAVVSGAEVAAQQRVALGCSIKWHRTQQPAPG